jgi:hypothetical protein
MREAPGKDASVATTPAWQRRLVVARRGLNTTRGEHGRDPSCIFGRAPRLGTARRTHWPATNVRRKVRA